MTHHERSGTRADAHQAAHERVHGLVTWTAQEDGPGEPEDAQLGDQQAPGSRVEAADRDGEETVYRRGQEVEVNT